MGWSILVRRLFYVGQHATEEIIREYVKKQGQSNEYKQLPIQQLKINWRNFEI